MPINVQQYKQQLSEALKTDLVFGPEWSCFEFAKAAGFHINVKSGDAMSENKWSVQIHHGEMNIQVVGISDKYVDAVSQVFKHLFDALDNYEAEQFRKSLDEVRS